MSQDCSLRYSADNRYAVGGSVFYLHLLGSVCEEGLNPLVCAASYAIVFQFLQQTVMLNTVKQLGKVPDD